MKKSILNLGKALQKAEQKTINGGRVFTGPCFEWCACPHLQELYWKPLYCSCNTGGSGGGNTGGGNPPRNNDPV